MSIDIIKYNLNNSQWWKGQEAIITESYNNFIGEFIEKRSYVCILFKMQHIRNEKIVHNGLFYVRDMNTGIMIGGIDYNKLILTGNKIHIKPDWLNK